MSVGSVFVPLSIIALPSTILLTVSSDKNQVAKKSAALVSVTVNTNLSLADSEGP